MTTITITNHYPSAKDIIVEVLLGDETKSVRIKEGSHATFPVNDGISILSVDKIA